MTPHDVPSDVAEVDEQLRVLTSSEVTPPPWAAVVDRIAVPPSRSLGRPRLVQVAMVVAGLLALVASLGAVSPPVRRVVIEPVANLLRWVDDDPVAPSEQSPGQAVVPDDEGQREGDSQEGGPDSVTRPTSAPETTAPTPSRDGTDDVRRDESSDDATRVERDLADDGANDGAGGDDGDPADRTLDSTTAPIREDDGLDDGTRPPSRDDAESPEQDESPERVEVPGR